MTFQVLTLEDEKEIVDILARFPRNDIHFDPRYVRLFQNFTKQRAIYFYSQTERGEFVTVFFERPLPDTTTNVQKDLLSPWYYGGPLDNYKDPEIAKSEFKLFLARLDSYAKLNGVISQFQRCNPVLGNHILYGADPNLSWNRKVIAIDLTKDINTIYHNFEKDVRRSVRRAHEQGLRAIRCNDQKAIDEFKKAYLASMQIKKTTGFYYFNDDFFTELFQSLPEAQLFTLSVGDAVVTSELVLGKGDILHHYLRGAYPTYRHLRPNGFAVDAIVRWAKDAGYKEFNMGGGLTPSPMDPLFLFKKSLSPVLKDYYLYKKVLDKDAYIKRCVAEGKKQEELKFEQADFFPEYKTS